jgi:ferredoxin
MYRIEPEALLALGRELKQRGFTLVGPTLRDGAIVYDELDSLKQLPAGWADEQESGHYRIEQQGTGALFDYTAGPHSWKKFLYPPRQELFAVQRDGKELRFLKDRGGSGPPGASAESSPPNHSPSVLSQQFAFIGVRSCELHAMQIHDRVFLGGTQVDSHYREKRDGVFIVAVNCTRAGGTCFCTSMNTGPKCSAGYDIALTEVAGKDEHFFIAEGGSERGNEILAKIPGTGAAAKDVETSEKLVEKASKHMGRTLSTHNLKQTLAQATEHPRFDDIATRCLTCTNCTMVCPTCFCSTVEDMTDLQTDAATRTRRWDSCFTLEFSKVVGGNFRPSAKARYRQWLTHKFSSWVDQFGTYGCVGCGRCITWCPVGIDVTAEIQAIRSPQRSERQQHKGA